MSISKLRTRHRPDWCAESQWHARKNCWRRSILLVLTALALCLGRPAPARSQQAESADVRHSESTVKAVYLYSFGRYVEWPQKAFDNATSPFVIGVLGEDTFGRTLDEIAAKKTIQGRRIEIRRFASIKDYRVPCHILFFSRSLNEAQQAELVSKTAGTPVLIVGETPGFAERGAIANFFLDGDRVRFEINVDNARRAGLRLDARLLSLGRLIGDTKPGGSQ
jgi:hypothetical protein